MRPLWGPFLIPGGLVMGGIHNRGLLKVATARENPSPAERPRQAPALATAARRLLNAEPPSKIRPADSGTYVGNFHLCNARLGGYRRDSQGMALLALRWFQDASPGALGAHVDGEPIPQAVSPAPTDAT